MSFRTWFLTACAIGSGYLGFVKWSNETIDETEKAATRFGVIESPEVKKTSSLSYQLGLSLAKFVTYSNLERYAKNENSDVPPDIRRMFESSQAETDGHLKSLNLDINFRSLDYSASSDDYEHSSGITTLAKLIRTSHGERAERAFKLGLLLEGVYWRAQFKKFNRPDIADMFGDDDAFQALRVLNEEAQAFGATGVPESDLDGKDKESFNRNLQSLVQRLESQLQSQL